MMFYLEPRTDFDKAIIDTEKNIYCKDLILQVLMDTQDWSFDSALEWYLYNIEPLKYSGLRIKQEKLL